MVLTLAHAFLSRRSPHTPSRSPPRSSIKVRKIFDHQHNSFGIDIADYATWPSMTLLPADPLKVDPLTLEAYPVNSHRLTKHVVYAPRRRYGVPCPCAVHGWKHAHAVRAERWQKVPRLVRGIFLDEYHTLSGEVRRPRVMNREHEDEA